MSYVYETSDVSANRSTTGTMSVGDYFLGTLTSGDVDWVSVYLDEGYYSFGLVGTGALSTGISDTYLRIYDDVGELYSDDDSGPDTSSSLTFYATSGTYYIAIDSYTHYSRGATSDYGTYGVSVTSGLLPSFDIELASGVLLSADASWSTTAGTGGTVTWGIRTTSTYYSSGSYRTPNGEVFTQLSSSQAATAAAVISYLDTLTNLTFQQETGNPNSATILFGAYSSATDGSGAYAYFPSSGSDGGDLWINNYWVDTYGIEMGTYSYFIFLHELGHALGLSHPGDYDASSGGTITYANSAQFIEDSWQYTVMSYFNEDNTSTSIAGYPDTMLLYDIYALQQLYGADYSTNATNTTYGFNTTLTGTAFDFSANSSPFLTIWDGGGRDTLDLSEYSNSQIISLVDGTFSSVGGYDNNVSIALGAEIENAIGGSGSDYFTGNALDNTMSGRDGNDTFIGGGGQDIIYGGSGSDTLAFEADAADYVVRSYSDHFEFVSRSDRSTINTYSVEQFAFNDSSYTSSSITDIGSTLIGARSDFDGDGDADIVWRHTTGRVHIWTIENGTWQAGASIGSAGTEWSIISAQDFDYDGDSDILWSKTDGNIYIWTMEDGRKVGGQGLGREGADWRAISTGDADGDGDADIYWYNATTNKVKVWTIENGDRVSRIETSGLNISSNWSVVGTGDFDGDGDDDILWKSTSGTFHVWNIEDGVRLSGASVYRDPIGSTWSLHSIGDFDGDGDDDLLMIDRNNRTYVWEMENGVRLSGYDVHSYRPSTSVWSLEGVADVNGDGTDDLIWQQNTGRLYAWAMSDGQYASGNAITSWSPGSTWDYQGWL